jgi:hypothetical protein
VVIFWSGYEHHGFTRLINLEESSLYLHDQLQHYKVLVVDDVQQKLDLFFPPSRDAV